MRGRVILTATATATAVFAAFLTPQPARAHCDTMDGPVVKAARVALEKGEVTPVLKWVKKEHEEEVRQAFSRTVAVRTRSPEARELADIYFFEMLVRVHREGEGAPYTGLKPAGTELGPAVVATGKALESGSVDALVRLLTDEVAAGTRALCRRLEEIRRR